MDAFEYQIKKDIRNNQIVREVDEIRLHEMWRSVAVGTVLVVVVLYAAWQHFELIRYGYRVEQLQQQRITEEQVNHHLHLEIDTLRRPQRIEQIALSQLKMVPSAPQDTVVLERVTAADPPARSVVAQR